MSLISADVPKAQIISHQLLIEDRVRAEELDFWQDSKKLGEFLGKWKGETETRKLHKTKQFEQLKPAGEPQDRISPNQGYLRVNDSYLSSLTRQYIA